jgi:EAL domain-containing protein (putative c-di-GMP-specific phosphodiesterase class I)/ActR/RegA family two-component response regulator
VNRKILLVDDDPRILASLRRCLQDRFDLRLAESGAEALDLVEREGPFAAVVSDMRMPGLNGLDLLREMRRRAPDTVRLVLSGHTDFETAIAAVNEGAVFRFHTKPVVTDILANSLECAVLRHVEERQTRGRIDPGESLVRAAEELRRAVETGQFRLYLQPQCRIADDVVIGAEALIRWAHPDKGLLGPADFLATAEAAGLMGDLTAWMLDRACGEAVRWRRLGLPPMRIAVNATALDFCSTDFPGMVLRVLADQGLPDGTLELELTEGAAVADPAGARTTMLTLADHGIATSLDDFGSGYSSLGWLRHLPVAKIKVDRIFIDELGDDPAAYRMLQAIVGLAKDLNMTVLAEGVETERQMDLIRRAGCDYTQGYLQARPMAPDDFTAWLAERRP